VLPSPATNFTLPPAAAALAPADKVNAPPAPTPDAPTVIPIDPAAPNNDAPDDIDTEPPCPPDCPEAITTFALLDAAFVTTASPDTRDNRPLDTPPDPVTTDIDPPVLDSDAPPLNDNDPTACVAELPVDKLRSPLDVPAPDNIPVAMEMAPDSPVDASPVAIATGPLDAEPSDPMCKNPDDVEPDPDSNTTLPPAADPLTPAWIDTSEPAPVTL